MVMTTKTTQDPEQTSKPDQSSIPTPEKMAEMMEICGCGPMMMQMMEHCLRKTDREKKESAGC
jgi:hypothetical protein